MISTFNMLLEVIEKNDVELVCLSFVDLHSREHKVTLPINIVDKLLFEEGITLRSLAMPGWQGGGLIPSLRTALIIPNSVPVTIHFFCEVLESDSNKAFLFESESIALRVEEYLRSTGIAELAVFGLESEIHLKNNCNPCPYITKMQEGSDIDSREDVFTRVFPDLLQSWLPVKRMYSSEQFEDSCYVSSGEITLDQVGAYCSSLREVVNSHAKKSRNFTMLVDKESIGTAVFGSVFLQKGRNNLFLNEYTKSQSEVAMFFMRGLLKHQCALSGITRVFGDDCRWLNENVLLEGSMLGYFDLPVGKGANPSLAFSAYLMAGLDGVVSRCSLEDAKHGMCSVYSLADALSALGSEGGFLTKGDVFSQRFIESYTKLNFDEL